MKLYSELAEHYFAIESHHRNIIDDVALVLEMTPPKGQKALLDVGCGSGEHLNEFARRGFQCTGIDTSDTILSVAKRRFPDAGVFIRSNMLDISFLDEFDVTVSFFGTINYLLEDDELAQFFRNIHSALKSGGRIFLEIWNSFPVQKIRTKKLTHISSTSETSATIERFRGFTLLEESPRTIVEVNYRYIISDKTGTRQILDQHIMRAFSHNEIETILEQSGFMIAHIFSGPHNEPYRHTSNRMIFIADKP
jgi:SAM-dependent methyltransferase